MSGNVPEEDGVEYRVEPQTWLTDGDAEAAIPEPDAYGDAYGGAYGLDPDRPAAESSDAAARTSVIGTQNLPASAVEPADDHGFDLAAPAAGAAAGAMRATPPYPASAAAQTSASKMTAPFSMLTRTRTKPARPAKPAKTAKPAINKKAGPRPPEARPAQQGVPGAGGSTRKAQLVLSRIEPWSVMKFSFMISLVGWVVLFVAVAGIYFVLSKIGVFTDIEKTVGQVTFSKGHPGSNASSWFAASRVLGYTMLAGTINVVLITALATVGAVVYNLVTHLAGGIEVTLKETD
jgi:hypothetical protein